MDITALSHVLGGGMTGVAAVFAYLFWAERKYNQTLTTQVLSISVENAKASTAQTAAITSLKDVIARLG